MCRLSRISATCGLRYTIPLSCSQGRGRLTDGEDYIISYHIAHAVWSDASLNGVLASHVNDLSKLTLRGGGGEDHSRL